MMKEKVKIEFHTFNKYYVIPGPVFFGAYCPLCGALFDVRNGIWKYFENEKKVLCCPNCENKPILFIDKEKLVEVK